MKNDNINIGLENLKNLTKYFQEKEDLRENNELVKNINNLILEKKADYNKGKIEFINLIARTTNIDLLKKLRLDLEAAMDLSDFYPESNGNLGLNYKKYRSSKKKKV